jgi:hypothetical protein
MTPATNKASAMIGNLASQALSVSTKIAAIERRATQL